MALLNSEPIELGAQAFEFSLPSVDGKNYSLKDFANSQVLVVLFVCVHCPYVQAIEDRLLNLARSYQGQSVQFVAICSNDWNDYPEDHPENILKHWKEKKYPFPYLIDESQEVAKAYGAVCTPDMYVYGGDRKLAYHGRLDDSWKDPTQVTREEMKQAIDDLLNGKKPVVQQQPSMGCSIKWKK